MSGDPISPVEADLRRQIAELERSNATLAMALDIERKRSVDAEAKLAELRRATESR